MPEIQGIPPGPVPMNMNIDTVEVLAQEEGEPGPKVRKFVQVSISTQAGVAFYFLPPEAAIAIGGQIVKEGEAAKSGLEIVRGNGALRKVRDNPQA